jgi:hypothetical protein
MGRRPAFPKQIANFYLQCRVNDGRRWGAGLAADFAQENQGEKR